MLLEYSSLFPERGLNLNEEIRKFLREQLIKIVLVLESREIIQPSLSAIVNEWEALDECI